MVDTEDKLRAFDPDTGRELWQCAGSQPPRYLCPSPIVHNGIIYATHGYHGPLSAVRAGGSGDVTATHRLWTSNTGSNVTSPIYHDRHLYWMSEKLGIAYCAIAATGELVYEQRLERFGGVYASPVLAEGRLYYFDRHGSAVVLAAKPEFEQLAHNEFESDESDFNASPAISDGQLFLRSDRHLYCVEAR